MKRTLIIWILLLANTFVFCQEWEQVNPIPLEYGTLHHPVGFSYGQKGYVVTGADHSSAFGTKLFYEYDAPTDTWTQKEDFPGKSRAYAIGDFYDEKAYLGFGFNFDTVANGILYLNDLWSYDPLLDLWIQLSDCPCLPRIHPAFITLKGKIYLGLGEGLTGELKDWWEYDINLDTWTQKTDFPSTKRHHPYQFAIGDYAYVGFGHTDGEVVHKDWYRYDPELDEWDRMSDLPAEGRVAGTQFSHKGKGYVLSGQGDDHYMMNEGEFWQYSPEEDEWTAMPSHPKESRFAPGSFIIDDYVYLLHGIYIDYEDLDGVIRFKLPEDAMTSTKSLEMKDGISIFPNPFSDFIRIEVENLKIENGVLRLFNATGKLLRKQNFNNADNNNFTFYKKDLGIGMYFFTIENNGQLISSGKLIAQ